MRIGLFDSGIGGLTVLKKIKSVYPNNDYVYFGDTLNLPYGNKSKEKLLLLADNCINFLLSKDVELIIIACGTVSSTCYTYLKNKYDIKIINVIDPTINYLNNSSFYNIGIIGTNATINSHVFKDKIVNKLIFEVACPLFVPYIESNIIDSIEFDNILNNYLSNLNNIECLVLGCTHYPLLTNKINKYYNDKVKLINMADNIIPYINKNEGNSTISLYFSKIDDKLKENVFRILNK